MGTTDYIQRLLPEILFEVFDLVIHTPFPLSSAAPTPRTTSGITAHYSNSLTPLTLTHVCRGWKNLAIPLSNLWSTIYITNPEQGHITLLDLWLQYSKARPLRLVFRDATGYSTTHAAVICDMIGMVAKHSERWCSFKVRMRRAGGEEGLSMPALNKFLLNIPTPQLETLGFSFVTNGDSGLFHNVWSSLVKNSPRLKEMQIWSTNLRRDFVSLIPFNRLATLSLILVEVNPWFFEHVAQCRELETLAISLDCNAAHRDAVLPIKLSLCHLLLVGDSRLRFLLDAFEIPSLSSLAIYMTPSPSENPNISQSLGGMLKRSNPKLHSFSFVDPLDTSLDWFNSLLYHPSMRSVQEFHFGGTNSDFALLDNLIASPWDPAEVDGLDFATKSTALPSLRRIKLDWLSNEGSLLDMVASRKVATPAVAKLESVLVRFEHSRDLESQTKLWEEQTSAVEGVDHLFLPASSPTIEEPVFRDFSMRQGWLSYRDIWE